MSNESHPAVERYLQNLSGELADLPEPERTEVIQELRNHAAEAIAAGREAATVLEQFGEPGKLARAYRVELALESSPRQVYGVTRFLTVLGLFAVTSLPSFIVIVVLGSFAIAFTGGGVAAAVGGLLSLVLPGTIVQSTLPLPQTFSELLAVGVGLLLLISGVFSGGLLYLYVRWLSRAFRQVLGDLRAAPA